MMTKTSIVNLVDLAGRYVQSHRINCLPFLKRFLSLVDLIQVFPLSIRPQARSNPSPVVLQFIALAGTKFFFPRFRAQSNGRSTDNVRPGWPFVRTNFRLTGHFDQTRKQAIRNKTKQRKLYFFACQASTLELLPCSVFLTF